MSNVAEMFYVAAILESREPSESLLTSRATKLQGNHGGEHHFDGAGLFGDPGRSCAGDHSKMLKGLIFTTAGDCWFVHGLYQEFNVYGEFLIAKLRRSRVLPRCTMRGRMCTDNAYRRAQVHLQSVHLGLEAVLMSVEATMRTSSEQDWNLDLSVTVVSRWQGRDLLSSVLCRTVCPIKAQEEC